MTNLIESLAFPEAVSSESFEMSAVEYEVEVYLKGFDLDEIKSKATKQSGQEQWGIFVPKTDKNASSASIRIRLTNEEGSDGVYVLTTKTDLGDRGKHEHEINTDTVHFDMFKQIADQGLVKTRYEIPGEQNGLEFKYEVDVFYNAQGEMVPWAKIDVELPEGTSYDATQLPLKYDEIIVITPEDKVGNDTLKAKVADLYERFFRTMNVYVNNQETLPTEPPEQPQGTVVDESVQTPQDDGSNDE